jgi:hypothetical protein
MLIFASLDRGRLGAWFANSAIPLRSADELEDLVELVDAALDLQRTGADDVAIAEWRVVAGALPGSRSQVAETLARSQLTASHRELLASGLLRWPATGWTLVQILEALREHDDPRIDRLALSLAEAGGMDAYWASTAKQLVLARFGDGRDPCQPLSSEECVGRRVRWQELVQAQRGDLRLDEARAVVERDLAWQRHLLERWRATFGIR